MANTSAQAYKDLIGSNTEAAASNFSSPYADQIAMKVYGINNYKDYASQYQQDIRNAWDSVKNRGEYQSAYSGALGDLIGKLDNAENNEYRQTTASLLNDLKNSQFSYNASRDPLYQQALQSTLKEANRTAEDVLARASIPSNGKASSYAVSAASQAANLLKSQLTDKQLEFYNAAYEKYYNDYANRLNLASAYDNLYNEDYSRLLNQASLLQSLDERDYARYQDQGNELYDRLSAASALDATDYARYQDQYSQLLSQLDTLNGQYNTDYANWSQERSDMYNRLATAIATAGYIPNDAEREQAGMSLEEGVAWYKYYKQQLALAKQKYA